MEFNTIMIVLIILVMAALIFFTFFRKAPSVQASLDEDVFSFDYLVDAVWNDIYNAQRQRPEDMNLNKYETEKQKKQKTNLMRNLETCYAGDYGAKMFVIDYISSLLQGKHGIDALTINRPIKFHDEEQLSSDEKYDILLCYYTREYGMHDAMHEFICQNHFDELRNEQYYVDEQDIKEVYHRLLPKMNLSFTDKMDVLAHRIYQTRSGHGCADRTRDLNVSGVSLGVSGISADTFSFAGASKSQANNKTAYRFSYDSFWMNFEGKQFYMSCTGCHSQKELIRVCKNLYRYHAPKNASANDGRVLNDMKDGSRVTVARPNFCGSWSAIVRKHSGGKMLTLEEQLTDPGAENVIALLKYIILGEQTLEITGGQNCGKTTVLRRAATFIRKYKTIRTEETIFELVLNEVMQDRNIATFRETDLISGQEALNFIKKTDCDVLIFGETVDPAVAAWKIQASQTGGPFNMETNHAETTEKLLKWYRNALLMCAGFSNELIAMEQVVDALKFDMHMAKTPSGHFYCERITEIIPVEDDKKPYKLVNIIVFNKKENRYEVTHELSKQMQERILANLHEDEAKDFLSIFEQIKEVA
jgi:pilus assembly protein CpaF